MKKHKQPIDDFFRNALKDHTLKPSDAAKEAFLKEAASISINRYSTKRRFLILLGGILLVITGISLYLLKEHHPVKNISSSKITESVSVQSQDSRSYKAKNTQPPSEIKNEIQERKKIITTPNLKNITPLAISKTRIATKQLAYTNRKIQTTPEQLNENNRKPGEEKKPVSGSQPAINELPPVEASLPMVNTESGNHDSVRKEASSNSSNPINDSAVVKSSAKSEKKSKSERSDKSEYFSTGLYYSPEVLFSTLEGNKYVNNFGVEGEFHFGKYSIRTGVGLSITKGTNELSISYNDYLGNYHKLDSMSFKWNQQHTKLVPTYFLSDKNVFDSLMKLDNAKIVKRYTYLQVPLILGYDFLTYEKISIGLRAGPVLSVLLNTKQISGEYDPGNNRIISINQISPERIQTNWLLMGGINCTILFSRKISLELEPEVRYYFNSVYEKSDMTTKPWSAGIRTAFHITY